MNSTDLGPTSDALLIATFVSIGYNIVFFGMVYFLTTKCIFKTNNRKSKQANVESRTLLSK